MLIEGYVLFNENDNQKFLKLFTRPGFRHCKMLVRHNVTIYDGELEMWSLVDGSYGADVVYPILASNFEELMEGIEYTEFVYVKYEIDNKPIIRFGFHSCVSHIKQLLGKKWWLCWTPYQLYKKLLKENNNGRII